MATSSKSAQLLNFNAHAIVGQDVSYAIVGGTFSPSASIDLTSQGIILSVSGSESIRISISARAFRKTPLGGYVARVRRRSFKTNILLQPFSRGDWAYSAGIEGFVPGSTPVTVSLRVGGQAGSATVNVYSF